MREASERRTAIDTDSHVFVFLIMIYLADERMTEALKPVMRNSKLVGCLVAVLITLMCYGEADAKPREFVYELSCSAQPVYRFNDLSKGLFINTSCDVTNTEIHDLSQLPEKLRKKTLKMVKIGFTPDVSEFFDKSFKKYVAASGFSIGSDKTNDYSLRAKLKEYKVTDGVGSAPCTVTIEWMLMSPDNRILLEGQATGRHTLSAGQAIADILDIAYGKALADIDWQGIATYLKEETSNKRADQEKTKQVKGDGDTALEHTVIRWYILSTPSGADVMWRVVSSTPDVKNTNSNYVGTTPFETTESFDIKGLNYNNSGDVQIEVTCEKPGYIPQRKRFNLRQAIEQKEISTKFNLVKEGE